MTLADLVYDEFIKFLRDRGIYEHFDRLLTRRHSYNLSDKSYIYSKLSQSMVDRLISWDTEINWNDIDSAWRNTYTQILNSARKMQLDPIEVLRIKRTKVSDKIKSALSDIKAYGSYSGIGSLLSFFRFTKYDKEYAYLSNISDLLLADVDQTLRTSLKVKTITDINSFLYTSDGLKELLGGYKCGLLNTILDIRPNREFNYVDISKEGKITYLPADKIKRVHYTKYYTSSLRRETTIGRFLNRFYKDKFDKCEIEAISNYVKGCFEPLNIEIWDSSRIKEAYLLANYVSPDGCITSVLHNSCMRYKECQDHMEFYEAAQAKIAVSLVNGKISGRALLWKVGEDLHFLDRIYTANPFMISKFVDGVLSKVNIDYYRKDGAFYDAITRCKLVDTTPITKYIIQSDKLKGYKGTFPYVDTFYMFDDITGTLTYHRYKRLQCTDGCYSTI